MAIDRSLNYYTILQLELFCERAGKNDEILYVEAFMLLFQEEKKSDCCRLMVQQSKEKTKGKPVLQEEGEKVRVGTCYFETYTPLWPARLPHWPDRKSVV